MKRSITIFTILALIGLASLAQAGTAPDYSNVGRAGLQFLKIGAGSRGVAMGGAFTAVSTDASALYWNPAGIARLKKTEVIFSHTNWLVDLNHEYVGVVLPMGLMGNIGFSATFLSYGEIERTTIDDIETIAREDWGEGLTPFAANDLALAVTYARNLTDKFTVGVTSKYVREKIAEMSTGGLAFDVGTYYRTGYKTLRIAMAILNYGPDISFSGKDLQAEVVNSSWPDNYTGNAWEIVTTPFQMPLQFKMGVAYDFMFGKSQVLTASTELVHPNDGNEKVLLGAEYAWKNPILDFALRGGYKYDPDWYETKSAMDNVSAGMGVSKTLGASKFNVDYAYTNMGYLENVHRFSVGLGF